MFNFHSCFLLQTIPNLFIFQYRDWGCSLYIGSLVLVRLNGFPLPVKLNFSQYIYWQRQTFIVIRVTNFSMEMQAVLVPHILVLMFLKKPVVLEPFFNIVVCCPNIITCCFSPLLLLLSVLDFLHFSILFQLGWLQFLLPSSTSLLHLERDTSPVHHVIVTQRVGIFDEQPVQL